MDFELTEEQKMLQTTIRDFAQSELEPKAEELDQKGEFPYENFKRMAELGLTGMVIPSEYGGSGSDELALAIAMEEIARVCASTADVLSAHAVIGSNTINLFGNEEQKKKYLPPLARGEKICSFAVTEPEAGSDISSIKTTAKKDGDDYILNGQKVFITNGNVCDVVIVFASVPELAPRGMTAFIVEKDTPGFTKGKKFEKLGMRAGTASELFFDDCRVPASNRLGEEGKGMRICLSSLDHGRIQIAAQALGLAQGVLDKAAPYSKERIQFGAPISKNQAITWKLADMATEIEAARLLVYKAAYLASNGQPFIKHAAMAKLYASELAMRAATQGIQIFGGYGYMMDSPMQRYFRDAKLIEIYEGTSEIQRLVISRAVLEEAK